MNTNIEIKNLFLKEIKEQPLEVINVSYLCEKLSIQRQTFYYYYRDIYDLVDSILYSYKDEFSVIDYDSIFLRKVIDFCFDNIEFFEHCLKSSLNTLIEDFLFDLLLNNLMYRIDLLDIKEQMSNDEILEIAELYTTSIVKLFENKILNRPTINRELFFNRVDTYISLNTLRMVCNNIIENRRRI